MFWRHKKSDKISVCINFKLSLWLRQRDGIYNYPVYKLSYREIEEIQLERRVVVEHATINRWVIKFTPVLEHRARRRKKPVSDSWRMDETYTKVKGRWVDYYRAVDKFGNVTDYYLSPNRDEAAAKAFLNKAIAQMAYQEKLL